MSYTIARVARVDAKTASGRDEALEIEDADGVKTLPRFGTLLKLNQ